MRLGRRKLALTAGAARLTSYFYELNLFQNWRSNSIHGTPGP